MTIMKNLTDLSGGSLADEDSLLVNDATGDVVKVIPISELKATTEIAEAGTDDVRMMTPLKTKQAIEAAGAEVTYDEQILTTSGNWVKPVGAVDTDIVTVQMWGAGGSGGRGGGSTASGGGGGGGAYLKFVTQAKYLAATVFGDVGVGGASKTSTVDGSSGGGSSFYGFTAPGGSGGDGNSSGGAGTANGGVSSDRNKFACVSYESGGLGAGIVSDTATDGADTYYAGAGGGSAERVGTNTSGAGGSCLYGDGHGGGGGHADHAVAGSVPGGGGGGAAAEGGTNDWHTGAGGDGMIIVTTELRGLL